MKFNIKFQVFVLPRFLEAVSSLKVPGAASARRKEDSSHMTCWNLKEGLYGGRRLREYFPKAEIRRFSSSREISQRFISCPEPVGNSILKSSPKKILSVKKFWVINIG